METVYGFSGGRFLREIRFKVIVTEILNKSINVRHMKRCGLYIWFLYLKMKLVVEKGKALFNCKGARVGVEPERGRF